MKGKELPLHVHALIVIRLLSIYCLAGSEAKVLQTHLFQSVRLNTCIFMRGEAVVSVEGRG